MVAGLVLDVTQAVPGVCLNLALSEFTGQVQGLPAEHEALFMVAEPRQRMPDVVEH